MTREEAIKEAYGIPVTKAQHEALQILIPELVENDDERIRKSLLEFLDDVWHMGKNANFNKWGKADCADWIYYIEKQKEQKSLNISAASEWLRKNVCRYINSEYNEFHKCVEYDGSIDKERLINDFEEAMQKEQKPVQTAKEAWKEMRLEVYAQASGNRHEPNYSDDSTKMFSLCDIDEIFEKIGNRAVEKKPAELSEDTAPVRFEEEDGEKYPIVDYKLIGQKPDWSEEDEVMLKEIISFFKDGSVKLQHDLDLYASFLEKRFKSLRPQQKVEWCEDVETAFKCIKSILIDYMSKNYKGSKYCTNEQVKEWIKWFDIVFHSIRPQPKPAWSEEDKRMLRRCIKSIESSKNFAEAQTFKEAKDKEKEWLISLPERFNLQEVREQYPIEDCDYGLEIALDILVKTLNKVQGYQTDDGIREHQTAIQAVKDAMKPWSYPYGKNETVDKLIGIAECLEMDGDCMFNGISGDDCGQFLRDLARKQTE